VADVCPLTFRNVADVCTLIFGHVANACLLIFGHVTDACVLLFRERGPHCGQQDVTRSTKLKVPIWHRKHDTKMLLTFWALPRIACSKDN
jgi:hypothetical protein